MKKPFVHAALASVFSLALATAAHANLLANGSFEAPPAPPNFFSTLTGAGLTGWTVAGGTIDLIDDGYWPASDGAQSVDLSGTPGPVGTSLSQTFATVPGRRYALTFDYANNSDLPPLTATADVEVEGLGTLYSTSISHTGSTDANMNYTPFAATFLADSASATLRFTHTGTTGIQNFQGVALDNVSVTQAEVPEPASLLLLGAGLTGLVGWRARRRS
jgi:choice-of-anchor C domain-containing protein